MSGLPRAGPPRCAAGGCLGTGRQPRHLFGVVAGRGAETARRAGRGRARRPGGAACAARWRARGDRIDAGARFVHDRLEELGWEVEIADAQKVKGLAPLACKTDRIDAWVLAELGRRQLVPAIWLPDPRVRAERERARWRLHLVRHRVALKNRVHSTLMAFGTPCPVSDL